MRRGTALVLASALLVATGCVVHARVPAARPSDARGGIAPPGFDAVRACGAWRNVVSADRFALSHSSFPETDPGRSCYVRVRYDDESATPDPIPPGCGYRARDERATLAAEADRYERIARGEPVAEVPLELACTLPEGARRAAAAANAATLRWLEKDSRDEPYAYATIEAFGYGRLAHGDTKLDVWLPGEACPREPIDLHLFGVNVARAGRAALALEGGVAPVVVFSGGAVHSPLVEAFLLDYVATCRMGVPADRVLLDPCANHTHTNVRNSARLLEALGGRTSYVVTDDGIQAQYLQEWTAFNLVGGSIDQRSLRDWGYLLGSWRQASVGIAAGFWFTPYRFWADEKFGGFSCVK